MDRLSLFALLFQPRSQDFFPFLNSKKGKSPGNEVASVPPLSFVRRLGTWLILGAFFIAASSYTKTINFLTAETVLNCNCIVHQPVIKRKKSRNIPKQADPEARIKMGPQSSNDETLNFREKERQPRPQGLLAFQNGAILKSEKTLGTRLKRTHGGNLFQQLFKMFVLAEMKDTVRIKPWLFGVDLREAIATKLNKKLANKVSGCTATV